MKAKKGLDHFYILTPCGENTYETSIIYEDRDSWHEGFEPIVSTERNIRRIYGKNYKIKLCSDEELSNMKSFIAKDKELAYAIFKSL